MNKSKIRILRTRMYSSRILKTAPRKWWVKINNYHFNKFFEDAFITKV